MTMKTLINIRTTEEERRRWKAQANSRGMDLSTYIRWLISDDEKKCLDKRKDNM